MTTAVVQGTALPWTGSPVDDQRFRIITLLTFGIALIFGAVAPLVDLPDRERPEHKRLPPPLAKLVLEKKELVKPPAKPIQIKVPEKKRPKPRKKPPVQKQQVVKKSRAPVRKVQKQIARSPEQARKKAAASGILAFSDDLADLRDDPGISTVKQVKTLTRAGNRATTSQRAIVTSGLAAGSEGIRVAEVSRDTGDLGLSGRKVTQISGSAVRGNGGNGRPGSRLSGSYVNQRSREEIQLVFDQNKGAVYALYHRALRKDPALRGKVVLELTIAKSGKVTDCRVLSSELNDRELERKLVARVKMFAFKAKDVDVAVVSYPIDFLPS